MKVLGINGSMRKDGNTAIIIRTIFEELEKEGISTELIQLPDVHINHAGLHRVKTAWHAWEKKFSFWRFEGHVKLYFPPNSRIENLQRL